MLTDLLDGTLPNLQDILLIQSSILEARDIYQPWRLGKQLLETKDLEVGPPGRAVGRLAGLLGAVQSQCDWAGQHPGCCLWLGAGSACSAAAQEGLCM